MLTRFAVAGALLAVTAPAVASPTYGLTTSTLLGAPDHWDYAVFDGPTDRVYIAHGDTLAVLDAKTGELAGAVEGIVGGAHGAAIVTGAGKGVTDDGRNGVAVIFDLKTLKILKRVPAETDADAIAADPASGHVFVVEGDSRTITVIDPATETAIKTINVGEGMEYAATDDRGSLYVAGVEKSDLLKIDTKTDEVVARWPAPDCLRPHGLTIDTVGHRLFMGCVNSLMMVIDADSGLVITKLKIGRGSDAIAYDPKRRRVFSPNGADGTLTVYQQISPDDYRLLETLSTAVGGRTMAVDPGTGRVFIVSAEIDPSPTPGGRPRPRPGTTRVMIFDPR